MWQAGEEEKDPRNLLLLFSITARVLDSLSVHHLTEDIFESLAVYFPIGERFQQCFISVYELILLTGSGSRRAKMAHDNSKSEYIVIF